jgi:hypothetical protein
MVATTLIGKGQNVNENAYRAFDPETGLRLRAQDAARMSEAGQMLIEEGLAQLQEANQRVVEHLDLRAALRASGEESWRSAPGMAEQSALLARAYGIQPRSPGNSFFVPATLCGKRTLQAATGVGVNLVGDRATHIGEQAGANSFLPLCTVLRPAVGGGNQVIGQFDALPTVTVLANETSQASDATPTTTGASTAPVNLATTAQASKQWVLRTVGGAQALENVMVASLRTKGQQQIIEGTGTNGEVLGLTANSSVPNAAGTTLAMSHVVTALDAVESGAGDGALAWVVTSAAAKILRVRPVTASGTEPIMKDNRIGGYPVIVIGGTTSAHAVFGRWSDLVVCEWSPLELAVYPFAIFAAGIIGVRGWLSFNAAAAVLSSFYCIKSIT